LAYSIRYYLSDRFRLRMEDSGIEQMTEERETLDPTVVSGKDVDGPNKVMFAEDEGIDIHSGTTPPHDSLDHNTLVIRTLDGEIAGDEFAQDAINYQILLNKIDTLLEKLTLDA
jgi:ankyrin repeat/BTB/POZ domain-containing protein 1